MPVGRGHRILRLVVAFAVGIAIAGWALWRAGDPEPREQRRAEEAVVVAARAHLEDFVAAGSVLEIVDPLATNRAVGKAYIYPTADGWQVSGHYRRGGERAWHPWLMSLDAGNGLLNLAVADALPAVQARAAADPRFTASPGAGDPAHR